MTKFFPNLVNSSWLWWIMCMVSTNQIIMTNYYSNNNYVHYYKLTHVFWYIWIKILHAIYFSTLILLMRCSFNVIFPACVVEDEYWRHLNPWTKKKQEKLLTTMPHRREKQKNILYQAGDQLRTLNPIKLILS